MRPVPFVELGITCFVPSAHTRKETLQDKKRRIRKTLVV
jgi:hypothetical protein